MIVRGYAPVPVFAPQSAEEREHTVEGDVLVCEDLAAGARASGPARLESDTNTCTVPDGWTVRIDGYGNALLEAA